MNKWITISIVLAVVAAGVVTGIILWRRRREHFGGVIKGIRTVPFNDGVSICKQYRDKCYQDFRDADPHFCNTRYNNCVSELYYSNFHRI